MPPTHDTLSFTLSEADFLRAQALHHHPHPWVWAAQRLGGVLILLAVLLSVWPAMRGDIGPLLYSGSAMLGLGILFYLYRVHLPKVSRRVYHQQKALQQPLTVEMDAAQVRWSSPTGQVSHPWGEFHRWKEDEQLFLLYHAENLFQMLPKRSLHGDEMAERLRGYLIQHRIPRADLMEAKTVVRALLWIIGPLLVLLSSLTAVWLQR